MKSINKKCFLYFIILAEFYAFNAWALTPEKSTVNSPQITISLNPDAIKTNEFTTLSIAISNPAATVTQLSSPFIQNLPAYMIILSAGTTTCGGKLSAEPNKNKIILANARIPANGICQILVGVTSTKAGTFEVRTPTGALQTDKGTNAEISLATLITTNPVLTDLRIKKSLNPPIVKPNVFNTLTITLTNPNSNVVRLSAPYSDSLPAGLVILGPSKTTCGGSLLAKVGTSIVVLNQARIKAYGSCDILLGVKVGSKEANAQQAQLAADELTKSSEQTNSNIVVD